MQLHSLDRGVGRPIEGRAASFAELKPDGAPAPTKLHSMKVSIVYVTLLVEYPWDSPYI